MKKATIFVSLLLGLSAGSLIYYFMLYGTNLVHQLNEPTDADYFMAYFLAFIGGVITSLIVYALFDVIGMMLAKEQWVDGVVTAKYYTPSSIGVGTGVAVGGQAGTTMTVNYQGEKFTVEVEINGSKIRNSVGKNEFDSLEVGDKVKTAFCVSVFTGSINFTQIVKG